MIFIARAGPGILGGDAKRPTGPVECALDRARASSRLARAKAARPVRFYFPDSQDQIDPTFDFTTEERGDFRVRQRDDRYAHEVMHVRAYDGMLVSKGIVDGISHGGGRYTFAQRSRLFRLGVRRFFRVDEAPGPRIDMMGDCGAFSYVDQEKPAYSVDDVIDFYDGLGFDRGISVDHVILGYQDDDVDHNVPQEWRDRQALTLELAAEFLARHKARGCTFVPYGVAQGWSPKSYAHAVSELQRIGYGRIALGGMVPLKTPEILRCLEAVHDVRDSDVRMHILGVTRSEHVERFYEYGVESFDSTSPFRQAFKDDTDNFYHGDDAYTAVRVPQVGGNAKLKRQILAGTIDQRRAIDLERSSLDLLARYDRGKAPLEQVLDVLDEYSELLGAKKSRREEYARTLGDRPWQGCPCGVCKSAGIHVAIFRGAERNKRRGFHNLHVFRERLDRHIANSTISIELTEVLS